MYKSTQITVRGVSPQTKIKLEQAAHKEGQSLNRYLQQQLSDMVVGSRKPTLKQYMSTARFQLDGEFDARLSDQRVVEPDLWHS